MKQVMGTNHWSLDADPGMLVDRALACSEIVEERGIAALHGTWVDAPEKLTWCQSGVTPELTPVATLLLDRARDRGEITSAGRSRGT